MSKATGGFMMDDEPSYFRNSRLEMRKFLPRSPATVLEIGCGSGSFRGNLGDSSEYWGVELDATAASEAEKKLDVVLIGAYDLVQDKIPLGYFDLIICNDVIEHVQDHDTFIESLKEKIKPSGHLVASIPNVRYLPNLIDLLFLKDWEYKDSGILDNTHLRFFTKKSIFRTFAKHDFEVELCEGINEMSRPGVFTVVAKLIGSLAFGRDVKFLQFGLRAMVRSSKNIEGPKPKEQIR